MTWHHGAFRPHGVTLLRRYRALAAGAPTNDDCGPCPGATLVPVVWEGQTYGGCP